jgi:energy-coupling factor transport system ATP-binding protein
MTAIRVAGLRFAYPSPLLDGSPVPALRGIDLEIEQGEFVAVMGPVGAGKSTLCYALNGAIPHAIDGEFEGRVVVCGQDTRDVPIGQLAMQVGLLFEDVEAQLFSANAADEVAFGPEAMGLPIPEIERRIDESLELVGLAGFRQRSPRTLSGGEQKRLALASVLAMRPQVLILDEPTSGLDPRGRENGIATINRLRLERGRDMTVVMATQDAEAVARFADRVIVLRKGRVALAGRPEEVFAQVERMDAWGIDVPQLARLAHLLQRHTSREYTFLRPTQARQALAEEFDAERIPPSKSPGRVGSPRSPEPLIQICGLSFRYPTAEGPALQGVTLDVGCGEWLAVIGVNGSGKSTLIKHLNGLLKPGGGTVTVDGQDTQSRQVGELAGIVSYLPQNPDRLIFSATVRQEVAYGPLQLGLRGQALDQRVAETLDTLDLLPYADHPPAVLSYGLRRQVALASVLAMNAPVLALDEPTVGLDRGAVAHLMEVISRRHRQGTTVIVVTHDLRLVAQYAQRAIVLQQGRLVAQGATREVLADVEKLRAVELEPLPVTVLASALRWLPPLPLAASDFVFRAFADSRG